MMTGKQYSSIRDYAFSPNLRQQKICGNYGNFATKEILFVVEGEVSVVERYCETCSQPVVKESKKNMRYL
jgi:hypothetical protein